MKPIIRYMVRYSDGSLGSTASERREWLRAAFGTRDEIVEVEIRVVERKKPAKKGKVKRG